MPRGLSSTAPSQLSKRSASIASPKPGKSIWFDALVPFCRQTAVGRRAPYQRGDMRCQFFPVGTLALGRSVLHFVVRLVISDS